MILGFIVSKERKLPAPKKIQAIVNMPPSENPQQIQVFNGMAQFYRCFIKNFVVIMAPITNLTREGRDFPLEGGMSEGLEIDQTEAY